MTWWRTHVRTWTLRSRRPLVHTRRGASVHVHVAWGRTSRSGEATVTSRPRAIIAGTRTRALLTIRSMTVIIISPTVLLLRIFFTSSGLKLIEIVFGCQGNDWYLSADLFMRQSIHYHTR